MQYKNRYKDDCKQNAYMNACDCLYYGCGKSNWNDCGLCADEAEKVWQRAVEDMSVW